jgi:hypothetical protein|tara:strand:- start:390 stop:650 length:261 start_codon:yes stop_codon:yes gene_type:complete
MLMTVVCVLEVDNNNMRPRIGISFNFNDKEGIILQSGKNLPPYLQTGEEGEGPFYGVSYPNSEYIWYNYEDIYNILNKSRIHRNKW